MKRILLIIVIIVGGYSVMSFVAIENLITNDVSFKEDKAPINKNVSAKEFKNLIDSGQGILLDVRTANEVAQGSIEGNINIDYYSSIFKDEVSKLDKNKAIYVYCRSGGRSGKAMQIMTDLGFVEVYNLIGGYNSWPYK